MKLHISILLVYVLPLLLAYNILIHSSGGGRSHIRWLIEVSETLSDMGHKITYLSDDASLQNSPSSKIKKVSSGESPYKSAGKLFENGIKTLCKTSHQQATLKLLKFLLLKGYQASFSELRNFIEDNKDLDLIICDFMTPACVDLALLKNIPLAINLQSLDVFSSAKPTFSFNFNDDRFNSFELLKEYFSYYDILKELNLMRGSFGIPSQNYVFAEYSKTLNLVHSFSGFELNKVPKHFHLVGPIFNSTLSTLGNEDILNILNSKKKIIYIAFGNNAQLPINVHETIIESMSNLLLDTAIDSVIYSTRYSCSHPNIYCGSNLPQINILNSPNIKLFISHCGMESLLESINNTKPILCFPLFADQPYSANKLLTLKIGDYLEYKELNQNNIVNKVIKVLDNIDKSKIIGLNSVMNTNSKDAKERAIYLILKYIQKSKSCNYQLFCYKPTIDLKFYWEYYSFLLPTFYILLCFTSTVLFIWAKALSRFMKLFKKAKRE
ncbi:UDP-Glycosyltransferase/glycogen phosphorylase [Neoconidiobolus thromboides FSU 785]|nr:UDP-Glycosyltransferase/glycogen phosphorylase [Neoconidiobolus thromboides FSU 785]